MFFLVSRVFYLRIFVCSQSPLALQEILDPLIFLISYFRRVRLLKGRLFKQQELSLRNPYFINVCNTSLYKARTQCSTEHTK